MGAATFQIHALYRSSVNTQIIRVHLTFLVTESVIILGLQVGE